MSVLAAIPPTGVLYVAAALFSIGLVGVACRRNILVMLLSVEIMLNAANLAFVAFSKVHGDVTGQVFVFFAMTVAAAEVAVGLAILIAVYRLRKDVDADMARDLHETHLEGPGPIVPEGPGGQPPPLKDPGVPGDGPKTPDPAPGDPHGVVHGGGHEAPAPAHAESH